jgi:hypothetical protein
MAGQAPQMLNQLPQMLGQMPQMATGLLGPLTSTFSSLGNGTLAADPAAATLSQTAVSAGGGGGGGGGIGAPGAGVVSSFTRPSSSFNAPNPPKLPTGWSAPSEPPAAVGSSAQPMAGGMGGLYGAPGAAAMGRDGGASAEKGPARTVQLTGRPAPNRGDNREN